MGKRQTIPLPSSPFEFNVILVGATHPGNLGAVCRTMLNYGFDKLRLVNPRCSPDDEEARKRAKHAGSILDSAVVYDSLTDCIDDLTLVVGTSGKREIGSKTVFRHFEHPWTLAERLYSSSDKVGLVFGEEGMGLSKEELETCDLLATLPTWEGYPISNLSHAVNTFLYELHKYRVINSTNDKGLPIVVPLDRSIHPKLRKMSIQACDEFANSLPGPSERADSVKQVLRRQIARSNPDKDETTRLIGALLDATTALQKNASDKNWLKNRRRRLTPKEEE
tara:strand:+ start:10996 stop:11832 length:837 start_codon:yes stop_codon:yes gene_type:complete